MSSGVVGGAPTGFGGRNRDVSWLHYVSACACIFAMLASCYRYAPVALTSLQRAEIPPGTVVRVSFRDATRKDALIDLTAIDYPFLEGTVSHHRLPARTTRIDVREARSIEIRELDGVMTVVATAGTIVGASLLLMLIALATKESCPFVYVDRGDGFELVGEAYAGAAFRSVQREDLLPLPTFPGEGPARVRIGNRARETQYTDLAQLVVVDHAPEARVLSTHDARLVVVAEGVLPRHVEGLHGQAIDELLNRKGDATWESDLERFALRDDPPPLDGVVASFSAPAGEGRLVLEVAAGNSALMELTVGRFFAAMGDRLDDYLAKGNDEPGAGPRLKAWREREGVDLTVEIADGDAWTKVATVPSVGAVALRDVAVELPAVLRAGQPVTVRLRAGTGFWRIDRIALSRRASMPIEVHALSATRALSPGRDHRVALAKVDGDYHVLEHRAEQVDLDFDLPVPPSGQRRSSFLRTVGYYNVHPPHQNDWQPGTLSVAARQPGGLARLALDLYRQYAELEREAPRRASTAPLGTR